MLPLLLFPPLFPVFPPVDPLGADGLDVLPSDPLCTLSVFSTGFPVVTLSLELTSLLDFLVTTVFLFPFSSVTISVTATSPSATTGASTILIFISFSALFFSTSLIEIFRSYVPNVLTSTFEVSICQSFKSL